MSNIIQQKNFRVQERLVDSDKVVFVFTGMLTKIWQYKPFIKRLNKAGYSVIIYDYPSRIVHDANINEWYQLIESLMKDVQNRIINLKEMNAKHFYAYGYSMGTIIAQKLTQITTEITHVILNLPYGDLAKNIWTSPRTRRARKSLKKQGITMEQLRQKVTDLDPIVNAKGLRDKKVLLHQSRRDRILYYPITKETKLAFEKAKVDMFYDENKFLGHLSGGAKNMLSVKKIRTFYDS